MSDHTTSQITYRGAAIYRGATNRERRWVAHVPEGEGHARIEADSAPEFLAAIDEIIDGRATSMCAES